MRWCYLPPCSSNDQYKLACFFYNLWYDPFWMILFWVALFWIGSFWVGPFWVGPFWDGPFQSNFWSLLTWSLLAGPFWPVPYGLVPFDPQSNEIWYLWGTYGVIKHPITAKYLSLTSYFDPQRLIKVTDLITISVLNNFIVISAFLAIRFGWNFV